VHRGIPQLPFDGKSMRQMLESPTDVSRERTQYFETVGNRAIWKNGWKAVAFHRRGTDFTTDRWELYHVDADFSESRDLANSEPEKLEELVDTWWAEARRNKVLPLDDRGFAERTNAKFRPHSPRDRSKFVYLAGMQHIGNGAAAPTAGRSFEITATVQRPLGTEEGALIAHGSWNSGYCLMIAEGHLVYDYNYYGVHSVLSSTMPLPAGEADVSLRFIIDEGSTSGTVTMSINGERAGELKLKETFEFFVSFQGLDIGADRLSPVRANARTEFPFTGGLQEVCIELLDNGCPPALAPMTEPAERQG